MTPERFAALADAYGGKLDVWPVAVRAAAREHARARPEAQGVLIEAARLDATLAAWTVEKPDRALAARIASAIPQRHAHLRRLRLWFSSLGACATLAGGVAAGAAWVALSTPAPDLGAGPTYELSVLGAPLSVDAPSSGGGVDTPSPAGGHSG